MRIIIDAMGGDKAPLEIIRGACQASFETEATLVLVGKSDVIEKHLAENKYNADRIEIHHADTVLEMDDDPMLVVRGKKDSSMSTGLRLLKDGADAFVSAGSTGALHAGATLIVRNIKGVRRAAIGAILPFDKPLLLMDAGANPTVTADNLLQWAYTGSVYMKNVMGVENPRVGLLNNGTEECKGGPLQQEAYKLLADSADINFCGNVEAKQVPYSVCDVLVTDGFSGNVVLKLSEGMSKFLLSGIKSVFMTNLKTKLAALAVKKNVTDFKNKYDASTYGGAPILGCSKTVIKAHGSSDARAFKNAILQAVRSAETGVSAKIAEALENRKEESENA